MRIITLINATKILNQYVQTKLPAKIAYKIMKLCKSAETEMEFYTKKQSEIISQYALRDQNGNIVQDEHDMITIMPDKISEANVALQELNDINVENPNIMFSIDELADLQMSAADMYVLDEFIEP